MRRMGTGGSQQATRQSWRQKAFGENAHAFTDKAKWTLASLSGPPGHELGSQQEAHIHTQSLQTCIQPAPQPLGVLRQGGGEAVLLGRTALLPFPGQGLSMLLVSWIWL
ncbi:hypothetical protein KIL84_003883 [Mauremys mutica]|uniref:Uncharacterized protein n=1 Tax=Mauremys mutica TaxID=74926 RepID=A0A9D3WWY5_9SAUR|nr:hypothetical protein KIL84_003883 [Mauremys mutica]